MTSFKFQGTGRTTGFDCAALILPAVILGGAVGVALIIVELKWWIIAGAAIAAAVRLYILYRKTVASAAIAAAFAREHERRAAEAARALAEKRRHEIAVAAAGAPQVHVTNTIDPAGMLAALTAAVQQPPAWAYSADVIRQQVER